MAEARKQGARNRFQAGDCARIWRDSVYRDMHPELLALMRNFELCYELIDIRPTTWLATQLLPPSKPMNLAGWAKPEDLVLRYRYDFLPKGIISRLTVRLHRFVLNPEMPWVTGALFQSEATDVLVELMADGSEIELRARGPQRKSLLCVVAADLDALNASFQGLRDKVDKRIPCNCKKCRTASEPEFYSEKRLLQRKEDNRLKVECRESYEEVSVLELLDGIRMDASPAGTASRRSRPRTARSASFSLPPRNCGKTATNSIFTFASKTTYYRKRGSVAKLAGGVWYRGGACRSRPPIPSKAAIFPVR